MSEADDQVLAEIIELARHQTGAKAITANTRLYADLGMTGDDAQEFMTAFAVKYDVDMESMVWLRFFDNESSMTDMLEPAMAMAISVLNPSFALRWQAAEDAEREITIGHLVEIARERKWRDPDATFQRRRKVSVFGFVFSVFTALVFTCFVPFGVIAIYALLHGQLGAQNLLVILGFAAVTIFFPLYAVYATWRAISAKLASAEGA